MTTPLDTIVLGESMTRYIKIASTALMLAIVTTATGHKAVADYNGDFLVRLGVTVVAPDASADVFAGGALIPGADADVSTEVIPSATLTYFFNKNFAAELFCCFARHEVEGEGVLAGLDLGDTWIFPPAVTLQYHFDPMHGIKPYVGAGLQYIAFFNEGNSQLPGAAELSIDNAVGFTLQAGADIEIGRSMYLNIDVKKTWLDTDAHWKGTNITSDVELDPWIFTIGVGYRFNLLGAVN